MLIDELGRDATGGSAWPLTRRQMFPPPELPATTSAVTASGITGEGWIAKEW
jgi:hypothetical protein